MDKEAQQNYLEDILQKYSTNGFNIKLAKYKATILVTEFFGSDLAEVIEMGSGPQRTAIKKGNKEDLDLLIKLKLTIDKPLKQIHKEFYKFLERTGVKDLKTRNISIRAKVGGINVDFVPALEVLNSEDVSVYSTKKSRFYNSNPLKHVELITQSGQQNSIKLLKLWIHLNKLEFESIYACMVALHVLDGEEPNELYSNFRYILQYLADDCFLKDTFKDVNDSSDTLSDHNSIKEKKEVQKAAKLALQKNLEEVLY